jgi:hypothetical protein
MNLNHDTQLERAIHRELKDLPELTAPESLMRRVTTVLEQRSTIPWYHRSWQSWPAAVQTAALVLLVIVFVGICLMGWQLSQTDACRIALRRAGEMLSGFNLIGNTVEVLIGALVLIVKKLGVVFMAACLLAAALGYAVCVGLGTVYLRLAFVKR